MLYPNSLPYLQTTMRQIALDPGIPVGHGNLCFLMSKNLDNTIRLLNDRSNCKDLNKYFYYYYNMYFSGKIGPKRYMFKDIIGRDTAYDKIEKSTKLKTFPLRPLSEKDERNMYFDLHRYIEVFQNNTIGLLPLKKIQLYWSFMKNIFFSDNTGGYVNRFVLINLEDFPVFTMDLREGLDNPVFMLYYTLFKYPEYIRDMNIDFIIFCKTKVLKFNPTKCVEVSDNSYSPLIKTTYKDFLREIKILYRLIKPDVDLDTMIGDTELTKNEVIQSITDKVNPFKSASLIKTTGVIKRDSDTIEPVSTDTEENRIKVITQKVIEELDIDESLSDEEKEEIIKAKVEEELDNDSELIDDMYGKIIAAKLKKTPVMSERDKMLRDNQKNIVVSNMTIKDLQELQANDVPLEVLDVSETVKTTNANMTNIVFENFNRVYNEKVMVKDIIDNFTFLNDKSIPMYIRDVKIEDSSDELNYKDTYTVLLEDANRQRHTIRIDIPKFIDDKFLFIGGNKKLILNQNIFYPVVKLSNDTVQIVSSYNKMILKRVETRSFSSIERFMTLVKRNDNFKENFVFGNAAQTNNHFITGLEFDEMAKVIWSFSIKEGKKEVCKIFFNLPEASAYAIENNIPLEPNTFFVGYHKQPNGHTEYLFYDYYNQEFTNGKGIITMIFDCLPEDIRNEYNKIKVPKRLIYTKVTVMKKDISVMALICFWEGLSSVLKKMNIDFHVQETTPKQLKHNENFIEFKDCFLVYHESVENMLLMNGLRLLNTKDYTLGEMDLQDSYMAYFIKVYGKANIVNPLYNYFEFFIDPVTLGILKDLSLPTDNVELMIYAVRLMCDNQYIPEVNQDLSRIRNNEIIPAILYDKIAKEYTKFKNSNGKGKLSLPRDCVVKELLATKTVEDHSTLNPVLELERTHAITNKGFKGVNLDRSFTMDKRTYDPSMVGVIAQSTSPDGSVGIAKTLTMEPTITSIRGYVHTHTDDYSELKDVNLFSPGELLMPLAATRDDATRLGHGIKQSKHVIPVKNSSPVLISNGAEEVCRFMLSSDFCVNAKDDGEIVEYNDKTKIMIAKYKDGTFRAVDLGKHIVKNSNGGFFLSNELITNLKVGDTFKKNDALAWHKDFFTTTVVNKNPRMNMGVLTKVALASSYNTYQDATFITEKMADNCSTEMCFVNQVSLGKNSNIDFLVKIGDHISVGDPLIIFDQSYEQSELNKLLANLGNDPRLKDELMKDTKNSIKSDHSGVIEAIKVYATVDVEEMSPTLGKVVNQYYDGINKKKKLLNSYDSSTSIVKCGLLMDETTSKIEPNKFGVIKGQKVEDGVLVEFYIKHDEPLEVASKIANFTGLKNVIGEVIPEGFEPYSENRPDEEISTFIASNSILKRMTPSIIITALGNKVLVELKRKLQDIYNEPE